MRKVIALFDEYQSKENAKHVIRSMKENARQGFWNGATCPLGYRLVEVEKRGAKVKRRLAIDAVEAETIRLIYKLYLCGDGTSGALGIKEVVKWLNRNGYRTRRGQTFGVGPMHKILTNTVYIGQWKFNRASSRTGERKPAEEIVIVNVPAIIEPELFERVQQQLRSRSPHVAAPRVTTGPILLTGLAVCATCGGSMTLRTGTSRSGAVHRYYTCSTQARKGKSTCKGRSIPMGKLDSLVTNQLVEHLFHPGRLVAILSSLAARRAEKAQSLNARILGLRRETTEAEDKLKRLYRLIEEGVTDLDDVLKDRLSNIKAERDRAKAALERASSHAAPITQIDPARIEGFGRLMRHNLTNGSVPFRKAYLRSIIDIVEVDDTRVRIKSSKDVLERAVLANPSGENGSQMSTRWRAAGDSNPKRIRGHPADGAWRTSRRPPPPFSRSARHAPRAEP